MKLLLALAAGIVGYCYYNGARARASRSLLGEEVHRWEGEGGNVPTVATPEPSPAVSYAETDPSMRH